MKNKTKCLLIIAIFALLLISLTTFSYAKTNLQVSDINVTVTKAKAEITWSKATNADGYDVYVDFPEVGYQFVGTVKNNNVQIIGFDESKTYAVKVKAYKYESGKTTYSDFSPEVKFGFETSSQITTKVGNITRIQATVASNGTYGTVEWNEASNATGYEIYASVGNGSFSYIGEVNSNRITVIGIKENIVYKVQVKPYTTVNGQRIYGSVSDTVVLKYEKEENPELVINRIRPNMVRKGEMMDVDDIVDLLSIDLIGVVPDDEYIITQTNKGEPVIQNKRAPSGKAYIEIAKRVLGEKIEVTIPGREKGFFARLKRLFKKQ